MTEDGLRLHPDRRTTVGRLAPLGRSGPLLIACGRFAPGVRSAVDVSMGPIEYPYRRFLLFSAIGGVVWAAYTCAPAYRIGTSLAGFPLASILISGIVTTVLIGAVHLVDRRRTHGAGARERRTCMPAEEAGT